MQMDGIVRPDMDPEQRYRYNGKELDEATGLYDYGARYYDPAIARWGQVDPLADQYASYSPYNYVLGNPVKLIDPDGMQVDDIIDIDANTGRITITEAEGDDVVRLVSNGGIEDDYTYGENGSFVRDNNLQNSENSKTQYLSFKDSYKAQQFYDLAGKSGVEFALLDYSNPSSGKESSLIITDGNPGKVNTNDAMLVLAVNGFEGTRHSHTHPNGATHPSGYYPDVPGDSNSLMPLPTSDAEYKGDAPHAINNRSLTLPGLPGWQNARFEVSIPSKGKITTYDGVSRAKTRKSH